MPRLRPLRRRVLHESESQPTRRRDAEAKQRRGKGDERLNITRHQTQIAFPLQIVAQRGSRDFTSPPSP